MTIFVKTNASNFFILPDTFDAIGWNNRIESTVVRQSNDIDQENIPPVSKTQPNE